MDYKHINNWAYIKLKDVGDIMAGDPAPQQKEYFSDKGIPFVRVADLGQQVDNVYIYNTRDKINIKKNNKLRLFPKGSVLFTKSGMSLLLNQRAILGSDMYVVSHIGIINPFFPIKSEWIYFWLKTIDFEKYAHATTLPSLKLSIIKELKIPLPPLNEQSQIVEKIKELFSELDKAKEELQKVREQLKIYRQSVLKAAFEGKLTEDWRNKNRQYNAEFLYQEVFKKREEIYKKEYHSKMTKAIKSTKIFYKTDDFKETLVTNMPKSWKQIKFIDLIKYEKNSIKRGPFGSTIKKSFFVEKGYKVYEQKNAINKDIFIGEYFIDENKYRELEDFSVKGKDFIVSCSGTIGKITQLPVKAPKGIINQALLKLSIDEYLFIDRLFLHLFEAEFFQRKILKDTRGSAMKNLASVKDIKNIGILLPPKEEQEQILQEIESRLSVCDKIEESVESGLIKIEHLRQSILKKAFEGKLVPQDPNDPPVEELLKQIKVEKEKIQNNSKKKVKR